MRKNIISKLSKIAIIFCSIVLTIVFCYEPFASGITEELDSLPEITLPDSTISKVDYSGLSDEHGQNLAELTIEAYIDPSEKVEEISSSDIMVVFDESLDAAESRSDVLSGIKNVIEKLPDSGEEGAPHRICLIGYSEMENTGYYTYDEVVHFNEPIPGVNIWKNHGESDLAGLPAVLRKYNKSLPSYDKCFLTKAEALKVLSHPAQMNKWNSKESRADVGLVLADRLIKKRNIALTGEERKSRPLIVIFAASSMPTQIVNDETISRAESIKTARNQITSNCENYGVTPSFYSMGDCNADGFDKMMAEIAGGADNHFLIGNVDKLSKKLYSILKKSTDRKSREIEITTSKFKDSNGEEKTFADLKNQYNFNLKEATVKSYTLQKNFNGEEDWVEDSEKISAKKVSASDDVLSCLVSIDQTAELATYNAESDSGTTVGPPRRVIIEITTASDNGISIHIRSIDEDGSSITDKLDYYVHDFQDSEGLSDMNRWITRSSEPIQPIFRWKIGVIVEQLENPDYESTEAWIYNGPATNISLTNVPSATDENIPDGWTKVPTSLIDADNASFGGNKVNIKISGGTAEYTLIFKNKKKKEKASRNLHLELKYTQKVNIPEAS